MREAICGSSAPVLFLFVRGRECEFFILPSVNLRYLVCILLFHGAELIPSFDIYFSVC
jgi:hypothetical protein